VDGGGIGWGASDGSEPTGVAAPVGKVGPNAVIQLGAAMTARLGREAAEALYDKAGVGGLLDNPPAEMIDQAIPAHMMDVLRREWPADADPVLRDAGERTADYVIANRIPGFAKILLRALPPKPAARLLMIAIRKNAWTFAGSGRCETAARPHLLISIKDNPLAMPDCPWHTAVLARLFQRLAASGTRVEHRACCRAGAEACRFEIRVPTERME